MVLSAWVVVSGGPAAWPGLHDGPCGWRAAMEEVVARSWELSWRAASVERVNWVPEVGSDSVRVPSSAAVMVGRVELEVEGGRCLGSVVGREGMGGVGEVMGAETTVGAGEEGGGGAGSGWGRASRERPRPNRMPAAAERRRDFMG